jgi:hypothetical protein
MMKYLKRRIGLLLSSISLFVASVSATSISQVAAGTSATLLGAGGYLIDLGIENVPGVTTAQAKFYYNIISIALVMWLAWVADEPSSAQFCVIGVGIAAFCAYARWFTTPNPGGEWGLIVMCALLAVLLYMTEKKRFLYGINGAGDPLVQIVVFLLILQSTIGLINGAGIFSAGTTVATPSDCVNGSTTYTSCTINGNVALSNIQQSSGTQNIIGQVFSALTTIASMGWNLLVMIIQLLISVACFSYVLYSTYPWILDSPQAVLLVGIFQVAIWIIYILAIFRYLWKPMPQDARG